MKVVEKGLANKLDIAYSVPSCMPENPNTSVTVACPLQEIHITLCLSVGEPHHIKMNLFPFYVCISLIVALRLSRNCKQIIKQIFVTLTDADFIVLVDVISKRAC